MYYVYVRRTVPLLLFNTHVDFLSAFSTLLANRLPIQFYFFFFFFSFELRRPPFRCLLKYIQLFVLKRAQQCDTFVDVICMLFTYIVCPSSSRYFELFIVIRRSGSSTLLLFSLQCNRFSDSLVIALNSFVYI